MHGSKGEAGEGLIRGEWGSEVLRWREGPSTRREQVLTQPHK